MPAFVAGFTAFFTGATVVGVVGTLGYLAAVAVFNAALGAIARKLTSKKGSEETGQRFQREVTVRATDAYEVFVYGRALVGGVTVYHNGIQDSDGVTNRMHHVVKWVGHECTSIELFRLDDRVLDPATDAIDWDPTAYDGTGLVGGGEFRGDLSANGPTFMRWYLGNQTAADGRLRNQAAEWTSDHKGQGQCYGDLEIRQVDRKEQTSKVYQKGFPQNIAALIHGKKVYDHRRYALNRDPTLTQLNSWWFAPVDITSMGDSVPASFWTTMHGVGGTNDIAARVESAGMAFEGGHRFMTEAIPVHPDSAYTLTFRIRQAGDATVPTFVQAYRSDQASAGNVFPTHVDPTGDWQEVVRTFGAGTSNTLPSSARFVRAGISSPRSASTPSNIDIQDMAVYLGTGSRHLVNVSSTWAYSESPPFCVADYLIDERLGFGKRMRLPINPSRYARNTDPGFRRENTLGVSSYWCIPRSDGGNVVVSSGTHIPLRTYGSLNLAQTGAPVGRRALVIAGSGGSGTSGVWLFSDPVPVDASGFYNLSAHARQDGAKGARFLAAFYDGNGAHIDGSSSDASGWAGIGTFHYWVTGADTALPSVWSHFTTILGSGHMSIPSCASFVRVGALCVRSLGTNGDTQQYFQDYWIQPGTKARYFIEPHEQIFWPSVSSAAAYTDAIVATPSGDQVRFACNGAGHTGAGHRSNVRDLLSSFNGRCVYVQSGFHISAGWEEPTKTLNKSDFRKGGMKIRAKAEMLDRYNHVRGAFYDPDNEYKRVPTATVTAPEYVARDSSQQLFHDVFLPFTNDWFMAQRVEFGILEQGDNQQLVEFQLKHSALDLMPGKVVAINHDVVSWQNHTLRMVDMETDLKQGVKLFGREDYEASYVDVGTSEYFSRQFNGVTSSAPIVPQVSSVSVTPRDGGIQLRWANPAARSFEWIDVYRRTTNAFSGSTLIKSTRNDEYFDTLQAGQTQFYWFRSRDFANNVSSVYPGLVSSFSGAGLFPVARDPEYVFFEEFRYQSFAEFAQKWEHFVGSGDITFTSDGTVGGKALQSSGYTWWTSRIRIPYDADALYQMRVKVRQTNSVDGSRHFYAGFTGYASDGVTPVNVSGSDSLSGQHFFVRTFQQLDSLDLWAEYTGHVRGHMPAANSGTVQDNLSADPKLAARMHDDVRYVSPLFILNNLNGTGTAQLDYVAVRKLIPYRTVTFDPEITAQSNWIGIPAVSIGGSAIDPTSFQVQSIVNVNIAGEYSVLPLNNELVAGGTTYFIAERYRPDFHPRMPSSGAYMATIMARVTSDANLDQVQFVPSLIAYTRAGSAVAHFSGLARLNIGSDASLGPGASFNQWAEASGTIRVNSHQFVNPNSGPYFLAPAVRIGISPTFANSTGALSSSWIAYLNITPGNP